jgi:hypothetical protein
VVGLYADKERLAYVAARRLLLAAFVCIVALLVAAFFGAAFEQGVIKDSFWGSFIDYFGLSCPFASVACMFAAACVRKSAGRITGHESRDEVLLRQTLLEIASPAEIIELADFAALGALDVTEYCARVAASGRSTLFGFEVRELERVARQLFEKQNRATTVESAHQAAITLGLTPRPA